MWNCKIFHVSYIFVIRFQAVSSKICPRKLSYFSQLNFRFKFRATPFNDGCSSTGLPISHGRLYPPLNISRLECALSVSPSTDGMFLAPMAIRIGIRLRHHHAMCRNFFNCFQRVVIDLNRTDQCQSESLIFGRLPGYQVANYIGPQWSKPDIIIIKVY